MTKEYQRFRWLGLDYVFFEYRPILWRVLDVIADKALLFSEYIIDCKNYNEKSGYCTWHESTLRSWLNGYSAKENRNGIDYSKSGFFYKAFSEKEKVLIVNKEITIMSNESGTQKVLSGYEKEAVKRDYGITHYGFPKPDYNISKKLFDDKVILLTAEELYNTEYGFKSIDKIQEFDVAKTAYPTEYAVANEANISSENEGNNLGSDWFVSSFLEEESFLSPPPGFAVSDGFIRDYYDEHNLFYLSGIRPATWIENKDYAWKKVSKENSIEYANLYPGRLVSFGKYPQKEIRWYENLYKELCSQNWGENNEIEFEGHKYRRVKRPENVVKGSKHIKPFEWEDREYAFFSYSPIVWRVLHADNDGILLLSERVLDFKSYGEESWESSHIRDWLNGYDIKNEEKTLACSEISFFEAAFCECEKNNFKERKIVLKAAGEHSKGWAELTKKDIELKDEDFTEIYCDDKVTLLTREDVYNESYGFKAWHRKGSGNGARVALPTEYAKAKGSVSIEDYYIKEEGCRWGTRFFISEKLPVSWMEPPFCVVMKEGTVSSASPCKVATGVRPVIYVEPSAVSQLDF